MAYGFWKKRLGRLQRKMRNQGRAAKSVRKTLQLEALESRLAKTVSLVDGDIVIVGTDLKDVVSVARYATYYEVTENGVNTSFQISAVTGGDVRFTGRGGDDYFAGCPGLNVWADGGNGNDTLIGFY